MTKNNKSILSTMLLSTVLALAISVIGFQNADAGGGEVTCNVAPEFPDVVLEPGKMTTIPTAVNCTPNIPLLFPEQYRIFAQDALLEDPTCAVGIAISVFPITQTDLDSTYDVELDAIGPAPGFYTCNVIYTSVPEIVEPILVVEGVEIGPPQTPEELELCQQDQLCEIEFLILQELDSIENIQEIDIEVPEQVLPGEINVLKFNDLDGNGEQDIGEVVLPGWEISLSCDGEDLGSQITDEQGQTTFVIQDTPAICIVAEVQQIGWTPTTLPSVEVQVVEGQPIDIVFGNQLVQQPIEVTKSWTHTDYNWDRICLASEESEAEEICTEDRPRNINYNGQPVNPEEPEGEVFPDDDVLADPLTLDEGDGKYIVNGKTHPKHDTFLNTQPGAFYALTIVDVFSKVDGLEVDELYSDCTVDIDETLDNEAELKLLSPKAKLDRAVKVAVANPQGEATEITELLYDGNGGSIMATVESANVKILKELEAGSKVFVLVKFQDNLKGQLFEDGIVDAMCDNTETVNVLEQVEGGYDAIFDDEASASLKITNKE